MIKKALNKFSILFIALFMAMSGGKVLLAQQIPMFSQYVFNGLYINPAYAGYKDNLYLHALYRTQWQGMDGAPTLLTVSADGSVARERVGLGALIAVDMLGAQQTISLMSNYAYRININETLSLRFGLGVGAVQYAIDGAKLQGTPGVIDKILATANYSKWKPEANVGLYLYSDRFYVGLSTMNLLSPNLLSSNDDRYHIEQAQTHMFLTAGVMLPISEDFQLKPSVLAREDFKSPTNFDASLMLLMYDRIWLGASYRMGLSLWKDVHVENKNQSSDAVSFIIEVFATRNIRVGYAYDLDFTKFRGHNNGTHEISLGIYMTPRLIRILSPRYF